MNDPRRILYLPVETKARELLGKTLLAAKAAERGWLVVMRRWHQISHWVVNQPPGAIVVISVPEDTADKVHALRRAGHRVVNLCEENIVYPDGLDYCQRKVGRRALEAVDMLLASGARNEEHLREFRPEGRDKYRLTGNPRFDTLLDGFRAVYEGHKEELQRRYGRYLLVNTNFARINPFKSSLDVYARMQALGQIADDAHAAYYHNLFDYKRRQMAGLQAMLTELARERLFDNIIIRPHPSENQETWKAWANGLEGEPTGVKIRYELTANDWLMAADAILHTGCTTGIEGLLLDRPVAAFVPETDPEMLNQADEVSEQVADAAEFAQSYATWRQLDQTSLRAHFSDKRETLKSLIANTETPFAGDRIVRALDELDVAEAPADFGRHRNARQYFADGMSLAQQGFDALRSRSHHQQKLPGISFADLRTPMEVWRQRGLIGASPKIDHMADSAWLVSREG